MLRFFLKKNLRNLLLVLVCIGCFSCQQNKETMKKPYVIEVTTFQYKNTIDKNDYWEEDAKVEEIYTSKQKGFIRRESGFSEENNEVVVVVYWETNEYAEKSMQKFMKDTSVAKFANMIDPTTLKMKRYTVK